MEKNNNELYEMYKKINVAKYIKLARLRWIGHVYRRPDEEPIKRILLQNPMNSRRKDKSRTRWLDVVKQDLQRLGINNWKEKAKDRDG